MDRWTRTTTWEQFLEEWEATKTQAGAVGLLYTGAKLRESGRRSDTETGIEDHTRCFSNKVSFFLETTLVANQTIATAARRLVVTELLNEGLGLSWTGFIGPYYAQLVDFMGTVHEDLRKVPFPRKADEFLYHSFYKWRAKEREEKAPPHRRREVDARRTSLFGSYYNRTLPLVKACVAWGTLPHVLLKQWFTPEMLQEIRVVAEPLLLASLGEKDELRRARIQGSLTWAMSEESPRDLYHEDGQTALWKRNGITLHFLRSL